MSDTMYEQWIQYRKDIAYLLNFYPDPKIRDYFSEETLRNIYDREPMEGMDPDA